MLAQILTAPVITAFLALLGTVSIPALTYFFTKKREWESELRRERLAHYKRFLASFSQYLSPNRKEKERHEFTSAANHLYLVAPDNVLQQLQPFLEGLKEQTAGEDVLWGMFTKVVHAMREDLGSTLWAEMPFTIQLSV